MREMWRGGYEGGRGGGGRCEGEEGGVSMEGGGWECGGGRVGVWRGEGGGCVVSSCLRGDCVLAHACGLNGGVFHTNDSTVASLFFLFLMSLLMSVAAL